MSTPRLNRLIELWELDKPVFGSFARFRDADGAAYYATSQQDFVVFDLEHLPADFTQLRVFLQFMLDRGSALRNGNLQPDVVPLVRIPSNSSERNQWLIKQTLDLGAYGLLAPHVTDAKDACALVSNARYAHSRVSAGDLGGDRGLSPFNAARYWGVPTVEYMARADTWPLAPHGELTVIALIESEAGVRNVRNIVTDAKGIAAVFVGTFDLSSSLGHPGETDHPETERAVQTVLAMTKALRVPCGVPVNRSNIEKRIQQGFRMMIASGTPSEVEETIRLGRTLSRRS